MKAATALIDAQLADLSYCHSQTPQNPAFLVMALHFQTQKTSRGAGRSVLQGVVVPALECLGDCVFVAPDAPLAGKPWREESNSQAVLVLLAWARDKWPSVQRVLLVGYSLGGGGCWSLASSHPGLFDAICTIAGVFPYRGTSLDNWTIPAFAVHSSDDSVVPISPTRQAIEMLQQKSIPAHLEVLKGVDHYSLAKYVDAVKLAVPWLLAQWNIGRE